VALKNNWANGDTFTPAAANDMANAVNAATAVTVNGTSVSNYELDNTQLHASDVGAYTRDEVDDAIEAAKNGPELITPKVVDTAGGNVCGFVAASGTSANYLRILNAAAGGTPTIQAIGTDTNIGVTVSTNGTGRLTIYSYGNAPTIGGSGPNADQNFNIQSKGSGTVQANGFDITTTSVVSVTGTSTLSAVPNRHYIILLGSGAVATLPTAVSNTSLYHLKNVHTASLTVAVTSSQTIDGGTGSLTILPKQSYTLVSDGSNWVII
jgi:hypothetical protein